MERFARLVLAWSLLSAMAINASEAGFRLHEFVDVSRDRRVLVDLWYPVDGAEARPFRYGLGTGRIVELGAIARGKYPLVMLSHGAMGAARDYSWIAEALARAGYVVAGVSHFGESYAYGRDTVDPAYVLRQWERPLDVSAALSNLLSGDLAAAIDSARVGFIGHSSGGATGLHLAGGVFDAEAMAAYCGTAAANDDRGCGYASDQSLIPTERPSRTDYSDARIDSWVILDPAVVPGFDVSAISSAARDERTLIVGSVVNDFFPFEHYAQRLASSMPGAASYFLDQGEGHFIYLDTCDMDIDAQGVQLCTDAPGINRAAVHERLKPMIVDFFDQTLKTLQADMPRTTTQAP